jgi:hypothetical protein
VKMYIDRWSYWLGLVSAVIALVMRTFNAFGVWLPGTVIQGTTIWYMSFFKAALLFLLINIATAIRIYLRMLADQRSNESNDKHMVAGGPAASKFRTATTGV